MHILVSNDDGYTAAGIKALAQEMRRFGRVTVVAPEHNHSGSSNSLTLNKPLTVTHVEDSVYVVSGTPSDCVHMALTGLLGERPDLVVSGINCGANMGDDTMYSGTVAAAIEGYIFGIDSIAFSQTDRGWGELDSAAKMAGVIVEKFIARKQSELPAVLLNINIPNMPFDALQGIEATQENIERLLQTYAQAMLGKGLPEETFYPGAREAVKALHEAGFKTVLVTNKMRRVTEHFLARSGLGADLDALVAGDDTEHPKPAPDMLLIACRKVGVEPAYAVMVGDSENDAWAAKAAGIRAMLVNTGYNGSVPMVQWAKENGFSLVFNAVAGVKDYIFASEGKFLR